MQYEYPLTKANRLRLARAFRHNPRVDFSIDCVLEDQLGQAFVDSVEAPMAFRITIGPFWYFAGDAGSAGGQAMMRAFPAYNLMMPSPQEWTALAFETFGAGLQTLTRYSFTSEHLSAEALRALLDGSPHQAHLAPIDEALAEKLVAMPDSYLDLSDFASLHDFCERGFGYAVMEGDCVKGIAYSSLVCSRGIEVSLYVDEPYRRQGVATAVGARLLLTCLEAGLRPNWDAANPESCALAIKLGFTPAGSYPAYYHRQAGD